VTEIVVLVHGLWLPSWSLRLLQRRLRRCGFDARTFSYRSVRRNLFENAETLHRYIHGLAAARVHFVGHSLGGLIIRALLQQHPQQPSGRVVTLGTPHLGSYPASVLARNRFGRLITGRSVQQLVAGFPAHWASPACELGTIAGDLSIGLGRFLRLPTPNDGVVAASEARLPGAVDHITLHVSHSAMLVAASVARQICYFLRYGRFEHAH
jgi:pimeloyl-ACP methyl ester carboxylesterase